MTTSNRKAKNNWDPELKKFFIDLDITRCEWPGCNSRFGLWPAHRVKQRFILTKGEWMTAALLCDYHHRYVEEGTPEEPGTHERMKELVDWVISKRGDIEYERV